MYFSLFFYIFICMISSTLLYFSHYLYCNNIVLKVENYRKTFDLAFFLILSIFSVIPYILVYGIRYGIGTDYFAYEYIHNICINTNITDYLSYHFDKDSTFYFEPGYYFLNILTNSFPCLNILISVLIALILFFTLYPYRRNVDIWLAFAIYFSTQFIYSMNGVRFSIAVCFVFLAFRELSYCRFRNFFLTILLASLFHKSAIICILGILLTDFNNKAIQKYRNYFFIVAIPVIIILFPYVYHYISSIGIFERYFSIAKYQADFSSPVGVTWIFHVLPIFIPFLFFIKKEEVQIGQLGFWLRVELISILIRLIGSYNTWYTRLSRFGQISEVILIPLMLSYIQDKKNKKLLTVYYIIWYIFYFIYFAIVNDNCDSLPYKIIWFGL